MNAHTLQLIMHAIIWAASWVSLIPYSLSTDKPAYGKHILLLYSIQGQVALFTMLVLEWCR